MSVMASNTPDVAGINRLKQMLETHCGLCLPDAKNEMLFNRLQRRMDATGTANLAEYLFLLFEKGDDELHQLINLLTINETYFFRHKEQFNMLHTMTSELLRERRGGQFLVWSAACSNGAEPYSLAICLKDLADAAGVKLRIMATDIDSDVLAAARAGRFSRRSVSAEMSDDFRLRYFTPTDDGNYQLKDEIREMVSFRRHNLLNDLYPVDVDVIFCRNVLIYFNEQNRRMILTRHYASLKNHGALFLSPVETLESMRSYFEEERGEGGIKCYRKWTMDGRLDTPVPLSALNHRRPLESYPYPEVARTKDSIRILGIVEGEERTAIMINELAFTLRKVASEGVKRYTLDLTGLRYISNEAIDRMLQTVRLGFQQGCRPSRILVAGGRVRQGLETAGFKSVALIDEVDVSKPPTVIHVGTSTTMDIAPIVPRVARTAAELTQPVSTRVLTAATDTRTNRKPAVNDAPSQGKPSRPATSSYLLDVEDVPDELTAGLYEDRLFSLLRRARSDRPGTKPTLIVNMENSGYADHHFFIILKRFLTNCSDEINVSIRCTDYMSLWLMKFRIPDSVITITTADTDRP